MIIKKELIKREIAGETILIPVGKTVYDSHGLFAVNEVASFLWDLIPNADSEEDLLKAVLNEYEVTETVARQDISEFLNKLRKMNII